MKTPLFAMAGIAMITLAGAQLPAMAQGTPQVVSAVDIKTLSTGYRGSKIIGSDVSTDKGDKIGTVDDLIISRDQKAMYAVLSVGGVLGMGKKLVAIDYAELHPSQDNSGFVVIGATKEGLKALPAFEYAH